MNMIHKTYKCAYPGYKGDVEYVVSAWQAMGSDSVNMTTFTPGVGWDRDYPEHGISRVHTEKLSSYIRRGIKTMDELIGYLFYVKA